MTYQVLARKWRPRLFSELIGQQHVVKALQNSIVNQKLHHAYLFTGTRGVGKTTIARVLAKSLNCDKGPTPAPCLECPTCVSIEEGRYVDLIEVDAASRTRVEDTKELLDNVQYMPTQGKYKIYLIDEIHMLSGHSFNALLKTLEEPPSHVIFLLATTDPQKIPVTVLSRCLQFTLKPLAINELTSYLEKVAKGEQLTYEIDALALLAKAANGSVRDSLSLLDQAIAYTSGQVQQKLVLEMLGSVDDEQIFEVLTAISNNDGPQILSICKALVSDGVDCVQVLERFIDVLHQIAICQCLARAASLENNKLASLAEIFSKQDIQLFYEICVKGRQDIALVPVVAIGFEMTMLRMLTFKLSSNSASHGDGDKSVAVSQKPQTPVISQQTHKQTQPQTQLQIPSQMQPQMPSQMQSQMQPHSQTQPQIQPQSQPSSASTDDWANLIELLPLSGMAKTVISHCILIEKIDGLVRLGIESNYQAMLTSTARSSIEAALKKYWQSNFKLRFEPLKDSGAIQTPAVQKSIANNEALAQAKSTLPQDEYLNSIVDKFDAKISDNSIHLISDQK